MPASIQVQVGSGCQPMAYKLWSLAKGANHHEAEDPNCTYTVESRKGANHDPLVR